MTDGADLVAALRRRRAAGVAWPLALFGVALAVRLAFALGTGFDGLYGQDPFAYFDYAHRLRDALAAFSLPPPFFYPIGYPLLVALAMAVVGVHPLAGQLVSVLAGSLAAPACYGLLRELAPEPRMGGPLAGLMAAFAPQLVISSLTVNSDATGFALAALAAWAMARYLSSLRRRHLALAALALGLAVLTRSVYGLLALPFAVAALLAWRERRLALLARVGAATLAVAIGGAVVASQFAGDIGQGCVSHLGDVGMTRWNPANALHRRISNPDGAFVYPVPIGVYYLLPAVRPAFVFPLLTPLLLFGAASLRRVAAPHRVVILGWLAVMLALFAGIAWENPRFPLSYFAPLAVLVGLGADDAARRWPHRRAVAAVCAVGVAGSLLWSVRDVRAFVVQKSEDLAVTRWCVAQVPRDARVLTFGLTETLRHYTSLDVAELADATPASLAGLLRPDHAAFLLVDAANLERQWSGLPPQANVAWLRAHAGLAEVGRAGRYTLWRIGAAADARRLTEGRS